MKKEGERMLQLFRKRLSNRKGFTLVELLVVISIIGILSAIAIPKFTDATKTARGAKIQADLRTMESAIAIYYASAGEYPADPAALVTAKLLAAEPAGPASGVEWATKNKSGTGGSYTISGGRALFSGAAVESF
jgi:general secretion pathway protein G